jgi:hypothetical protein
MQGRNAISNAKFYSRPQILRMPLWWRQSHHLMGAGASVQPVSHELVGKANHKEEETG